MDHMLSMLKDSGPLGPVALLLGALAFGWGLRGRARPRPPIVSLAPLLALVVLVGVGCRLALHGLSDATSLPVEERLIALSRAAGVYVSLPLVAVCAATPALLLAVLRPVASGGGRVWGATLVLGGAAVAAGVLPFVDLELAMDAGPAALLYVPTALFGLHAAWVVGRDSADPGHVVLAASVVVCATLVTMAVLSQVPVAHPHVLMNDRHLRLERMVLLSHRLLVLGGVEASLAGVLLVWAGRGVRVTVAVIAVLVAVTMIAANPGPLISMVLALERSPAADLERHPG